LNHHAEVGRGVPSSEEPPSAQRLGSGACSPVRVTRLIPSASGFASEKAGRDGKVDSASGGGGGGAGDEGGTGGGGFGGSGLGDGGGDGDALRQPSAAHRQSAVNRAMQPSTLTQSAVGQTHVGAADWPGRW
jgi:hypothetical protein